jgi:hydrogenase maturation protease
MTGQCELEYDERGYLLVPEELARAYFPQDVLVALSKPNEVWLLPVRGAAAGGLLLKQRNLAGDRSVLLWEQLPAGTPAGTWPAYWDESKGALRVAFGEGSHV